MPGRPKIPLLPEELRSRLLGSLNQLRWSTAKEVVESDGTIVWEHHTIVYEVRLTLRSDNTGTQQFKFYADDRRKSCELRSFFTLDQKFPLDGFIEFVRGLVIGRDVRYLKSRLGLSTTEDQPIRVDVWVARGWEKDGIVRVEGLADRPDRVLVDDHYLYAAKDRWFRTEAEAIDFVLKEIDNRLEELTKRKQQLEQTYSRLLFKKAMSKHKAEKNDETQLRLAKPRKQSRTQNSRKPAST